MAEEEFDESYMARLEGAKGHWWVRGMQEVGAAILASVGTGLAVLDAGCGAGTNLPWLAGLAEPRPVHAFDLSAPAVEHCRRLGLRADLVRASATALPYPEQVFDLVLSVDVLQHLTVSDAAAAMAEVRRVLRPGGRLLLRTNAAFGRSRVPEREDWRLYSPETVRRTLTEARLGIDLVTPVNAVQGLWASIPRPSPGRGVDHCHEHGHEPGPDGQGHGLGIPRPASSLRNAILLRLVRAEARWLAATRRPLPFGHSIYALAHRPA
jgi:SAM-dependent methyltransferase